MRRDVLIETVDDAGVLEHAVISAVAWQGLRVQTADGGHATLAIVDGEGRIIESGDAVREEVWNVVIMSYSRFLIGEGTLRVYSGPHGILQETRGPDDSHRSGAT